MAAYKLFIQPPYDKGYPWRIVYGDPTILDDFDRGAVISESIATLMHFDYGIAFLELYGTYDVTHENVRAILKEAKLSKKAEGVLLEFLNSEAV